MDSLAEATAATEDGRQESVLEQQEKTQGWCRTGVQREAQAQSTAQTSAEAGVVPGAGEQPDQDPWEHWELIRCAQEKKSKSFHLCPKQDCGFLLTFRLLLML